MEEGLVDEGLLVGQGPVEGLERAAKRLEGAEAWHELAVEAEERRGGGVVEAIERVEAVALDVPFGVHVVDARRRGGPVAEGAGVEDEGVEGVRHARESIARGPSVRGEPLGS